MRTVVITTLLLGLVIASRTTGSEIREGKLATDLVPGPVEYNVLLPDGYKASGSPLPLLLYLHGGFGSREQLVTHQSWFDELWKSEKLPMMVIATPTVGAVCGYLDFKDGSQRWESFVVGPFLDHVRGQYNVSEERAKTTISGWSMGGVGALRLAIKHPDVFGGVAAFEPAIVPALTWDKVKSRNRYWFAEEHFESLFGSPIDEDYWRSNNPASIVHDAPDRIREMGLRIYIECGNEDYLYLHEGAKFLHDTLWNERIPHGFHLVDQADHMDNTHKRRCQEGLQFLGRVVSAPAKDPLREKFRTWPELMERSGPLPGQSNLQETRQIVDEWYQQPLKK